MVTVTELISKHEAQIKRLESELEALRVAARLLEQEEGKPVATATERNGRASGVVSVNRADTQPNQFV